MTIAAMQTAADELAGANIGYDQAQRWSFFRAGRIISGGETDCSASCGVIAKLGGYPVDLGGTFYTGNFASKLKAAGFSVLRFTGLNQVKPGDFLLTPGHHVIFVRDATRWWSAEFDERGKSAGGQAGNQNGRETRYRTPYLRPGGWTYIVRPPADPKPTTPATSTTVPLALQAAFAAQQAPRFGGSRDYAGRGRELAKLGASLIGATETLITASGERPDAMQTAITKALGSRWSCVVHPGGAIALWWRTDKYARAGLTRSTRPVRTDPWHGALCVPLRRLDSKTGLDVIVVHVRPKTVATLAQKRADVAAALSLVGTWPAIIMGDFAQDADQLMATGGFVRVSPDADSYDPAGEQRIDAIYVQRGVLAGTEGRLHNPGGISDHLWPAAKITKPTSTTTL